MLLNFGLSFPVKISLPASLLAAITVPSCLMVYLWIATMKLVYLSRWNNVFWAGTDSTQSGYRLDPACQGCDMDRYRTSFGTCWLSAVHRTVPSSRQCTDRGAIMMLPFHRARMNALELSERIKYCELAAMLTFHKMYKYSILFSNY